jgi:hypothetical protein
MDWERNIGTGLVGLEARYSGTYYVASRILFGGGYSLTGDGSVFGSLGGIAQEFVGSSD